MGILSAIVLYAVIWFLTLLCVLPMRLETQGDRGRVLKGTHAGSPENPQIKKRMLVTSAIAFVIWAIVAGIILSGWITVEDLDWFNRMATPEVSQN